MSGPLTVRLAGEVADGLYAACSFSQEALAYLVDNVRIGAEKAGRDLAELDLAPRSRQPSPRIPPPPAAPRA